MGKWADLPLDLLYVVEDYVALYIDKVRFRAVSLEWSSHLPKLPDHRAKKIHFLLQPLENSSDEATHGLYNPLDKKVYKLYVPELTGKMAKGSFYGWIVAIEEVDPGFDEIYLINPITRAQIKLPPRTEYGDGSILVPGNDDSNCRFRFIPQISSDYEFNYFCMKFSLNQYHMKIVLSSDPKCDECMVIATFSRGQIAWCKFGEKNWTRVDTGRIFCFVDILYSKGYLYALNHAGRVIMFENIGTGLETKFTEITADDGSRIPIEMYAYLVECSDGSLIVAAQHFVYDAYQDRDFICTKEFKVYKYYPKPNSSWVEVKSIGDDVLFVGFGSVRSIPSANLEGFKKNHIYFCDFAKLASDRHNENVESCVGVFSLEDGTVEPLQGFGQPRPVWTNIC